MMQSNVYPYPVPTTALRWNRAVDQLIEEACRFEQLIYEKAGYRPDQPRDYRGWWSPTGASGTLSVTETWGDKKTLEKHVKDHGKDFGVNSSEDYTKRANDFYKRGRAEKLPTVIDKNGVTRIYEPKTNTFGSYNPDGTTRTFYKPSSPRYFENQIRQHAAGGRVLNMPQPPANSGGGRNVGGGGLGGGSVTPGQIPGRRTIKIPGFDV
jgi:hypothetical protein